MDIVAKVMKALSNVEVTNLLADKRVYFLHASMPKKPYIEFSVIDEHSFYYADNIEVATGYVIQVDIFSETDYYNIEQAVRKHMKLNGFTRDSAIDLYEKDTSLYHKAIRFSITEATN